MNMNAIIVTAKADYRALLQDGFASDAAHRIVRSDAYLTATESERDAIVQAIDKALAAYNVMVITRNEAERYEAKDYAIYNINNRMRWLLRDEDAGRYEIATATEVLADMKALGESIVTIEL